MTTILRKLQARIHSEYILTVGGILKIMVFMMLVNHYVACAWFYIAVSVGEGSTEQSWTSMRFGTYGDVSMGYAYATSLHWSLTQFTPASMEVHPTNGYERVFNIIVIILGLGFFSSFVSSITQAMTHIRAVNAANTKRDEAMRAFFNEHRVSPELTGRIWDFCRENAATVAVTRWTKPSDVQTFSLLPEFIKDQLQEEVLLPVLKLHPFFRAYWCADAQAVEAVCREAAFPVSLRAGEALLSNWKDVHEMVFVVCGMLEYHVSSLVVPPTVSKGEWLCEAALWAEGTSLEGPLLGAIRGCDTILIKVEGLRKVAATHGRSAGMLGRYAELFVASFTDLDHEHHQDSGNVFFNDPEMIRGWTRDVWGAEYVSGTNTSRTSIESVIRRMKDQVSSDTVQEPRLGDRQKSRTLLGRAVTKAWWSPSAAMMTATRRIA